MGHDAKIFGFYNQFLLDQRFGREWFFYIFKILFPKIDPF